MTPSALVCVLALCVLLGAPLLPGGHAAELGPTGGKGGRVGAHATLAGKNAVSDAREAGAKLSGAGGVVPQTDAMKKRMMASQKVPREGGGGGGNNEQLQPVQPPHTPSEKKPQTKQQQKARTSSTLERLLERSHWKPGPSKLVGAWAAAARKIVEQQQHHGKQTEKPTESPHKREQHHDGKLQLQTEKPTASPHEHEQPSPRGELTLLQLSSQVTTRIGPDELWKKLQELNLLQKQPKRTYPGTYIHPPWSDKQGPRANLLLELNQVLQDGEEVLQYALKLLEPEELEFIEQLVIDEKVEPNKVHLVLTKTLMYKLSRAHALYFELKIVEHYEKPENMKILDTSHKDHKSVIPEDLVLWNPKPNSRGDHIVNRFIINNVDAIFTIGKKEQAESFTMKKIFILEDKKEQKKKEQKKKEKDELTGSCDECISARQFHSTATEFVKKSGLLIYQDDGADHNSRYAGLAKLHFIDSLRILQQLKLEKDELKFLMLRLTELVIASSIDLTSLWRVRNLQCTQLVKPTWTQGADKAIEGVLKNFYSMVDNHEKIAENLCLQLPKMIIPKSEAFVTKTGPLQLRKNFCRTVVNFLLQKKIDKPDVAVFDLAVKAVMLINNELKEAGEKLAVDASEDDIFRVLKPYASETVKWNELMNKVRELKDRKPFCQSMKLLLKGEKIEQKDSLAEAVLQAIKVQLMQFFTAKDEKEEETKLRPFLKSHPELEKEVGMLKQYDDFYAELFHRLDSEENIKSTGSLAEDIADLIDQLRESNIKLSKPVVIEIFSTNFDESVGAQRLHTLVQQENEKGSKDTKEVSSKDVTEVSNGKTKELMQLIDLVAKARSMLPPKTEYRVFFDALQTLLKSEHAILLYKGAPIDLARKIADQIKTLHTKDDELSKLVFEALQPTVQGKFEEFFEKLQKLMDEKNAEDVKKLVLLVKDALQLPGAPQK